MTRRTALGLVLATLAAALVAVPGSAALGAGTPYGHTVSADLVIPLRDGVKLVGDVIYPAGRDGRRAPGRFPVLLSQNPYSCETSASSLAFTENGALGGTYYADRGYILAVVCVRGTGRSGGDFDLFGPVQQQDGVELVRWARRLGGSNGTIGLFGCSYQAVSQLFTAAALPPGSGVKAMLPACTGAELYRETGFSGGVPTQTTINYFKSLGYLMGPRAGAWGAAQAQLIQSGGDAAYDTAWSKARTPGAFAQQIARSGIPTLLWSGYQDVQALGSQELYTYLQNAHFHRPVYGQLKPGQPTTPRYQVIVGPGGHGEDIDPAVAIKWYDTWLKGKRTGMERTTAPMHLYQLGTGKYVDTAAFPPVRDYTSYHLGKGIHRIIYSPSSSLSFTTKPFKRGLTLAGPISADLVASTTGKNLQLVTTLYDVAPDGTATKLTTGNLIGSLRTLDPTRTWYDRHGAVIRPYPTYAADRYLTPNRPYSLAIPLSPRLIRLAPDHSLRLTITTQGDRTRCNEVVGPDPCFPTAPQQRTLPGTYTVHSTRLNLPVTSGS